MTGRERQHNRFIVAILLAICVMLVTVYSREGDKGVFHRLQRFSQELVAPLQRGVSSIMSPIKGGVEYLSRLDSAVSEREKLDRENNELQDQLMDMNRLQRENDELRNFIKVKNGQKNWDVLVAEVIGSNPDNWKETREIAAGYDDGVQKYMAVLDENGFLVGRVVDCTAHTSMVLLITDAQSSIGAKLEVNGEIGLIKGEGGGTIKLELINQDAVVNQEDMVVTAGLGGTCPAGIPLGRIKEISEKRTDLSRGISITPLANMSRLDRVMVVLSPPPSGVPLQVQE
jgi:rod shape-determining protein MreC